MLSKVLIEPIDDSDEVGGLTKEAGTLGVVQKKLFLKFFPVFTGKHLWCWILFLIKFL